MQSLFERVRSTFTSSQRALECTVLSGRRLFFWAQFRHSHPPQPPAFRGQPINYNPAAFTPPLTGSMLSFACGNSRAADGSIGKKAKYHVIKADVKVRYFISLKTIIPKVEQ